MHNIFSSYPSSINGINLSHNIHDDIEAVRKFFSIKERSVLYKLFVAKDINTGNNVEICVYTSKKRNVNGYFRYFIYLHTVINDSPVYIYENAFSYEGSVVRSLFKKLGFSYDMEVDYSSDDCFKVMCEVLKLQPVYTRYEN